MRSASDTYRLANPEHLGDFPLERYAVPFDRLFNKIVRLPISLFSWPPSSGNRSPFYSAFSLCLLADRLPDLGSFDLRA